MTHRMTVGLDYWIVEDGNYPDFLTGDRCRFALEFHAAKGLKASAHRKPYMRPLGGCLYNVNARVEYAKDQLVVLDCGVRAYRGRCVFAAKPGDWLEGNIYLNVDPFFYKDQYFRLDLMPALIYTWDIETIFLDTTPWLEREPKQWYRDIAKSTTEMVKATGLPVKDRTHGLSYFLAVNRPPIDAASEIG